MRGPSGTGRGSVSMAGGLYNQGSGKGNGEPIGGAIAFHDRHVFFKIYL